MLIFQEEKTTGWGTCFTNAFSGNEDDRMGNLFHKCFFRKRRRREGEPFSQMLFQEEKTTGWGTYFINDFSGRDDDGMGNLFHK
jgi:hypothetical protein